MAWHKPKLYQQAHTRQGVLCIFLAFAAQTASADSPGSGHVVLARELPPRNAFRPGAPGPATTVATARDDIVLALVKPSSQRSDVAPQALADSNLGGIVAVPGQRHVGATLPVAAGSPSSVPNERLFASSATHTASAGSGARAFSDAISGAVSGMRSAMTPLQAKP